MKRLIVVFLLSCCAFAQKEHKTYQMSVSVVVIPSLKVQPTVVNVQAAVQEMNKPTADQSNTVEIDAELAQAVALGYAEQTGKKLTLKSVTLSVDAEGLTISY